MCKYQLIAKHKIVIYKCIYFFTNILLTHFYIYFSFIYFYHYYLYIYLFMLLHPQFIFTFISTCISSFNLF